MASITHRKYDTITDWTQEQLNAAIGNGQFPQGTMLADIVQPSDWNDEHDIDIGGLVTAGTNVTITGSGTIADPLIVNATGGGGGGSVDSVNGQTGVVVLDTDDISDTASNRYTNDTDIARLANTSGTNTGDVTVTDSTEIDFTLTGQDITASLKAGSVDEAKLDASVNASLDLADSAAQFSFRTIAVSGQSDVVADSASDTLTLIAGSNVTITTNAGADSITISASGGGGSGINSVVGGANISVDNTDPDNPVVNLNNNIDVVNATTANFGLNLADTAEDHYLAVGSNENLTADRTLGIVVNDANRTLTIAGNTTISGTNTGDQNLFSTIAVSGQSNVVADSTSDTLTLAAGSGISITTNATTDTITITNTGGGGSGYSTIQEEGSSLTQRATMNFVGAGITAADDAGNTRTNVTLDSTLNAMAGIGYVDSPEATWTPAGGGFTGTTAPTTPTYSYAYQQLGKVVNAQFWFKWGVAGSAVTDFSFTIPAGLPTPAISSNFGNTSSYVYRGVGGFATQITNDIANQGKAALTYSTGGGGSWSLFVSSASVNLRAAWMSITYRTP